jgi:hypothetical protein
VEQPKRARKKTAARTYLIISSGQGFTRFGQDVKIMGGANQVRKKAGYVPLADFSGLIIPCSDFL